MPSAGINSKVIQLGGGAAGTGFTKTYWFVNESTNTALTHVGGANDTYLLNNSSGPRSIEYNPSSKSALWNSSTNKFDFTSLKVGDVVTVTGSVTLDNLAAQEIDIFISMAEGTASAHEHQVNHSYFKTAATGREVTFTYAILMHDADAIAGSARIRFASAQAASITGEFWSTVVTEV
tara:strand:+ start:36 stop:569 length:534 start_codon:yes stop_codon:yes gene_type:complete